MVLRVPPRAFRPPPKVESALLRVRVLPAPRVAVPDEEHFRVVVRAAFAQRRKTLANSLAAGLALSQPRVRDALRDASVDPMRRAETLTLEEFARLAECLADQLRSGADARSPQENRAERQDVRGTWGARKGPPYT